MSHVVGQLPSGEQRVWDAATGEWLPDAPDVNARSAVTTDGNYRIWADGPFLQIIERKKARRRQEYDRKRLTQWAQPKPK